VAYVTHRQGLYRTGFRPATNPYAATQLGLSPFEPEVLHVRGGMHGLEQGHPFTPGGGWGLHGLGDIVPNGSIVQYTGQWPTDIKTTPDATLAAVVNALNRDGLHVLSSSQSGGFIGEVFTGSFTATLQIQVSNGMGFGQAGDVASIVDHEVYLATAEMPSGSSASVISIPGSTPNLTPASTDWGAWIQQNAMWIGLGVLGVFVLPDLLEKF